jgi:glycosyltransferase involved in cell wall biosynthesis
MPGRVLYFVTEDWYFVSHRLPLAAAARERGYEVFVATRVRDDADAIRGAGLHLIPFENSRGGINPFREFHTLLRLIRLYRRERPDIAHHVSMKPVLYGSIAARLSRTGRVVNALAGMGWLFTSTSGLASALKPLVRRALSRVLRSGIVIVQNPDDERLVADLGVPHAGIRRIAGSGVDLQRFSPTPEPGGVPAVVLPARLLWDKGVGEFVAAATALRRRGVAARWLLAGMPDPDNPASVPQRRIDAWVAEGAVEHVGWIDDMPAVLAASAIVCLPSYREGLPKALIEAAAAGRPVVTTDVPGCREVVREGENGLLVPVRDVERLADALQTLLLDPALRQRMGARGREIAESEYGIEAVVAQTLALYGEPA